MGVFFETRCTQSPGTSTICGLYIPKELQLLTKVLAMQEAVTMPRDTVHKLRTHEASMFKLPEMLLKTVSGFIK